MGKISPFQIIILVVSGIAIVVGVLLFAFSRSNQSQNNVEVSIWGIMPSDDFTALVNDILDRDRKSINVVYTAFDPENFETELVENLAEGKGPDIILLPQDLLLKHQNKLYTLAYEFYPQRDFKDTFIEESELFIHAGGIIGIPFTVDPLVMYWNRTMFTEANLSQPPSEWGEILEIASKLTNRDSSFSIIDSGVALGEFRNINQAKEIFITLLLQAGNPVVRRDVNVPEVYDVYHSILDERLGYTIAPIEAALNFFTQFSNPSKAVYSWNRSLPSSKDMFLSGDLAIYFGFASEYEDLKRKNPNLNFDVALMPHSSNGSSATYGKMTAFSITKNTQNTGPAYDALLKLTSPEAISFISNYTKLPPVRRDLLVVPPQDAALSVFYNSALRAKGIYDPDPVKSQTILQDMVESFVTGRSVSSDVVNTADILLEQALNE